MRRSDGERPPSWAFGAGLRTEVAARVLAAIMPLAFAALAASAAAILLLGPEHRSRLVPTAVAAALVFLVARLARSGRTTLSSWLVVGGLALAIASGMALNGGVRAPIYALGIPLVAYVAWVFGSRAAAVVLTAMVLVGGVFVALAHLGLLRQVPPPSPLLMWVLLGAYMLTTLAVTVIPSQMLRRAVTEAERREHEAEEAAERFSTIFEMSPDAINVSRVEDGAVVLVNPAFTRLTGYAAEEVVGRSAFRLGVWVDAEDRRRFVDGLREHGAVDGLEARFRCRDGSVLVGAVSARAIEIDGRPHVLWVGRDVTERISGEEALRESEERYRRLFDSAGDAILILRDGHVTDCNARALEIFGCDRDALVGRTPSEISPPTQEDGRDSVAAAGEEMARVREGSTHRFTWLHRRGNGATFLAEIALSPLRLGGEPHLLAIVRDVSERVALERRLAQIQKMEAVGTLAGGIAHDFNNILAIIVGYVEVALLRLPADGAEAGNLREVLAAAERARQLVAQILTFGRQVPERPVPCDLGPIVKETLKFLRSTLPPSIVLRERLGPAGVVLIDPTLVHQVLLNLCTNAYHAMEEGGGVLEVAIEERRLGEAEAARRGLAPGPYAVLSVSDTGEGIPAEVRGRIFEPYFTTKGPGKGTGLGLAVVHGIVTKAAGQLRVTSERGVGTTIEVWLPETAAVPDAAKGAAATEAPGGAERILVVDDEPPIVEMTREFLEGLGYEVTTAGGGAEALERFREKPGAFDLVVTDLAMPGIDGEELVHRLRALRPETAFLLCTGYAERIAGERLRALGVAAVLEKPFSRAGLAVAVREALGHRAAAAPAGQEG